MSVDGLRRPVILSLSLVAAVATSCLLYQAYIATGDAASQGLHRSNAVRRPRRRRAQPDLQRASAENNEEDNHTERPGGGPRAIDVALMNLEAARQHNFALGTYRNDTLLPESAPQVDFSLELSPNTLGQLFNNVAALHPQLTSAQLRSLRQHIDASFIRQFVRNFFDPPQPDASERIQLETVLPQLGLDRYLVRMVLQGLQGSSTPLTEQWTLDTPYISNSVVEEPPLVDGTMDDDISIGSPTVDPAHEGNEEEGHNMLNLLYHIAQEQARRNGYVHRGVECNSCGACPIQGIRYHCANCFDYDLCETCEAKEVHIKTHVFYKIRIPAPSRGQIKQVLPKWYPGNPNAFPQNLPKPLMDRLKSETNLDNPDIQGLYDQYKCLAGREHPSDPAHLGVAIDRKAFDMYFIPVPSDRPTPANLIYDRIFAFYDANDDGLIDFMEFIRAITRLNDKSFMSKLTRMFQGYDLDGDGYVSRKDFLRMFRAYYDLSTQLNREMLARNEDMDLDDEIRDTVQGTHPISAAFGGNMLFGHLSRPGEGKVAGADGDPQIMDGPNGVLQDDLEMTGDRLRAVGDTATGSRLRHHPFRSFRADPVRDEPLMHLPHQSNVELLGIQHADDASEAELTGPDPPFHTYGWPPLLTPEPQDIISSLHADIPVEDITDPVDRSRVVYAQSQRLDAESDNLDAHKRQQAINERWRRRRFYLDEEEGMKRPVGYAEPDSSDDESDEPSPEMIDSSRRQSLRSRSSSKVRFDDSAIDTDYETRSNASSRSLTQNERWGGYELSRPTTDVGADVLYEAVQQGFNELLDCLFQAKEDLALNAQSTRRLRMKWKKELDQYAANGAADEDEDEKAEALRQADKLRTEELMRSTSDDAELFQLNFTGPGADSPQAQQAVTEIQAQINEAINNVNAASALSRDVTPDPPRAPVPPSAEDLEDRDPTLPQFRPDVPDTEPAAATAASSPPPPKAPPSPPSRAMLARLLRHRRIEEEAAVRGGPGRLSFMEFRQLVEAQATKDGPARDRDDAGLGGPKHRTPEQIVGAATAQQGGDEEEGEASGAYWEKSADLGRLAFLGTWLEMAGF